MARGFVPTPSDLCMKMVNKLFEGNPPSRKNRILYPGCGNAPFALSVEEICQNNSWSLPTGIGIESDPDLIEEARSKGLSHVTFKKMNFLSEGMLEEDGFEYIIGNPPYVSIEQLNEVEKEKYRSNFSTATNRFDLYLLFFERSLDLLSDGGVLTLITPEKFEYVDTASPLRKKLTNDLFRIKEIEHVEENTFGGLVTFPCVTTTKKMDESGNEKTKIVLRDGTTHSSNLPDNGDSWAPYIRENGVDRINYDATLEEVTERISCGVATGADSVFVHELEDVPNSLDEKWTYPTVSGRQLEENGPYTNSVFICPYLDNGDLPEEKDLGLFGEWVQQHRERLEDRSCVKKDGKPWYAWHENPPLQDILRPKIVFKDITKKPEFWAEERGTVVPRHSVYYTIPKENVPYYDLLEYLNSPEVTEWIRANCQKAANGFYRLQSRVLKRLPVPDKWAPLHQKPLKMNQES